MTLLGLVEKYKEVYSRCEDFGNNDDFPEKQDSGWRQPEDTYMKGDLVRCAG